MTTQSEQDLDVIVIGGGPVGQVMAGYCRKSGFTVALVESELLGGECGNWGCIPSKAMLRPVAALAGARRVEGASEAISGPADAAAVLARRDRFVHNWHDDEAARYLESIDVELVRGHGRLSGVRRVLVTAPDGSTVQLAARRAVAIATGSRTAFPQLSRLDDAMPWSSRQATGSHSVPDRLAIVGGGAIGVEMATAWRGMGSQVTLLARGDGLLPTMEPFVGEIIGSSLSQTGVDVRIGAMVTHAHRSADIGAVILGLENGEQIEADEVLFATGKQPKTDDVGLETIGLIPGRWLDADETCTVLGVEGNWLYALGDVNQHALLTHQGKYQARVASAVLASRVAGVPLESAPWGRHAVTADYVAVPQVIFCSPPAGTVGLTADAAERAGHRIRTVDVETEATVAGAKLFADDYLGRARLVVDEDGGYIVGATFVGPGVDEMIHSATIAVVGQVPMARLRHAVPCFPSISEVWLRLLEAYDE